MFSCRRQTSDCLPRMSCALLQDFGRVQTFTSSRRPSARHDVKLQGYWLLSVNNNEIYHMVNCLRSFLSLGHLVTQSLGHSVPRSLGHSVTWSLGHSVSVTWSLGDSVIWSVILSFQHADERTDGHTTSGSTDHTDLQIDHRTTNHITFINTVSQSCASDQSIPFL